MQRVGGQGWLALIGGGEFSFGETIPADRAWIEKVGEGPIGFLPTASGSRDYFENLAGYLDQTFQRSCELIPIYRHRDAKRAKNLERIERCSAIYIGGGVADELIAALAETPALEALGRVMGSGGVVIAIAAGAQSMGRVVRSLFGGSPLEGLSWLPAGVVEPNFDPGHDRRLRQMMQERGVAWGLGLPAGSAVLMGPNGAVEPVGRSFLLDEADGDYRILGG